MVKNISVRESGRRGGKSTLGKYGVKHFSEMGKKSAIARKTKKEKNDG